MQFPVKIVKDESEYFVMDQTALDFHLERGWKIDPAAEVASEVADPTDINELARAVDKRFTALEDEVTALQQTVAEQQSVITALQTPAEPVAPPAEPVAPPAEPATDK